MQNHLITLVFHFTKQHIGNMAINHQSTPESKDELFTLITSLSRTEKRYIKGFSIHNSDKSGVEKEELIYLQLFDAINKETAYNEAAFKEKYRGASFLKNFPQQKAYLKNLILVAMRSYHKERHPLNEVIGLWNDYQFYKEKGITESAFKVLKKAKVKAIKHRLTCQILKINEEMANFLIDHESRAKRLEKSIRDLQLEQREALNQVHLERVLTNGYHNVFVAYRSNDTKTMKELLEVLMAQNNLQEILLKKEKYTFQTRLCCLLILVRNASFHRNWGELNHNQRRLLKLIEQEGNPQKQDFSRYVKVLSNYLASCHHLNFYGEFPAALDKLRNLSTSKISQNMTGEVLQNLYLYETLFYLNTGKWEQASQMPDMIHSLLKNYPDKVNESRKLHFRYNILIIHLFLEDWKTMKKSIDELMNHSRTGFFGGVVDLALILEVIYFIEMEASELIPFKKRAIQRRLSKNYQNKKELLKLIGKISDTNPFERPKKFEALADFLFDNIRNPKQNECLIGFPEMYYWAKARAQKIPITEAFENFKLS